MTTLLLLPLLLTLSAESAGAESSGRRFNFNSNACVEDVADGSVVELSPRRLTAFAECADSPDCWHLLVVTNVTVTRFFAVTRVTPKFESGDRGQQQRSCELHTKVSAVRHFKEVDFCPAEGEANLRPLRRLSSSADSLDSCAAECVELDGACEFLRFNGSCYAGGLASFMAAKAFGARAACGVWKRIRRWDDKFVTFYAFNCSLANLADVSRYNASSMGAAIGNEGATVRTDQFVQVDIRTPSMLSSHLA